MWKKLSHKLSEDTPIFGSREPLSKENVLSIKKGDECNTKVVEFYTHAGTHIDSPYHFNESGLKVDEISLKNLKFNKPCIVDIGASQGELIAIADIEPYFDALSKCDFLMIRTGHEKYRRDEPQKYVDGPGVSIELAELLIDEFENIEGLGVDFASVSSLSKLEKGYRVHEILLNPRKESRRPVLIVEDISLSVINETPKQVWIIPFDIRGLDGAPVTVLAELSE